MAVIVKPGESGESESFDSPPILSSTDLSVMAGIPFLVWVAWLARERHWPVVARKLAPLAVSGLARRRSIGGNIGGGDHALS